jgi:hypothetical protein
VTLERLRAYADAAAAFYRSVPWKHLANADLLVVESPAPPRGMKHAVVLGNAGEQFGLGFFDSRKAFERMFDGRRTALPTHAHGVTFGPERSRACPPDRSHGWSSAARPMSRAFSQAARSSRWMTSTRPSTRRASSSTATLSRPLGRALTPLEEAQDLAYAAMEVAGRLRLKRDVLSRPTSPHISVRRWALTRAGRS